jgi:hypothetical protein
MVCFSFGQQMYQGSSDKTDKGHEPTLGHGIGMYSVERRRDNLNPRLRLSGLALM